MRLIAKDWYSVVEVAELAGLAPERVRAMCASGQLRAEKIGDRARSHWRLPRSTVEQLVDGLRPPAGLDEATLRRVVREEVAAALGSLALVPVVDRRHPLRDAS